MNAFRLMGAAVCIFFCVGNIFSTVLYSSLTPRKPHLVVLLMVKDEAEAIVRTLETYLSKNTRDRLPDNEEVGYFIYDTGSTDGTEQKALEFFEKNGIHNFHIEKEPFVNYAVSRNRGVELTEKIFSDTPFILFVDAEWYMHDFDGLLAYAREHEKDDSRFCRCYNVRIVDTRPYSFYTARLIRKGSQMRFVGRVHEIPDVLPAANLPQEIYFKYEPTKAGGERSQKRWTRDKQWLLEDYADNPRDRRIAYLLGQTCSCLQEWDMAKEFYLKAAELEPFDELTYLAYYNLGEITEFSNFINNKKTDRDWNEALQYYLKAYCLRPHRAEPLVKLASHYLNTNDMPLSYLFAHRAVELSYPSNDVLFIEQGMYDFDRYRLLGINAWHVGDFEGGEKAIRQCLTVKPGEPTLEHDLACYENRKKAQQNI